MSELQSDVPEEKISRPLIDTPANGTSQQSGLRDFVPRDESESKLAEQAQLRRDALSLGELQGDIDLGSEFSFDIGSEFGSEFARDAPELKIPPGFRSFIRSEDVKSDISDDEKKSQSLLDTVNILGAPPFEAPGFNIQIVSELIRRHTNIFGQLTRQDQLTKELQSLLERGLTTSLTSNEPGVNSQGVLSTLSSGIQDAEVDIDDPEDINEVAERVLSNIISQQALEELSIQPQRRRVSEILTNIFGGPFLNELRNNDNLSGDELIRISDLFRDELESEFSRGANRQDLVNTRQGISQIADERLRQVLLSQVGNFASDLLNIEQQTATSIPGQIQPLSGSRGIVLHRDSLDALSSVINDNVIMAQDNPEVTLNLARAVNTALEQNNIHILKDGRRIRPEIKIKTESGQQKNPDDILREISNLSEMLSQSTNTFFHFPVVAEGRRLTPDDIGRQLVDDVRNATLRKEKRRRRGQLLAAHPSKVVELGDITIKIMKSEGGSEMVIEIYPNAKLGDLMKLANRLRMSNGILEDSSGKTLLNITSDHSNVTIQKIVHVILQQQKSHAGKTIIILYKPQTIVGGSYLAGALSLTDTYVGSHPKMRDFIPSSGIPIHNKLVTVANIPISSLHHVGGILKLPVSVSGRQIDVPQNDFMFQVICEDGMANHGGTIVENISIPARG